MTNNDQWSYQLKQENKNHISNEIWKFPYCEISGPDPGSSLDSCQEMIFLFHLLLPPELCNFLPCHTPTYLFRPCIPCPRLRKGWKERRGWWWRWFAFVLHANLHAHLHFLHHMSSMASSQSSSSSSCCLFVFNYLVMLVLVMEVDRDGDSELYQCPIQSY